jgi:hypothetical protein
VGDDYLYTYYRGRGRMKIVPRNARGWAIFALYMAIVIVPLAAILGVVDKVGPWWPVSYVVLMLVVTFLWVRWAISRSKQIDLDDVDRNYADYLEWKRRQRRD